MKTSEEHQDVELQGIFEELSKEGRLVDYIVGLLADADGPEIEVNGVTVSLQAPNPPISDKSCYKKCLKEDIRNPGSYKECIKKCRPKSRLSIGILEAAL